MAKKARKPQRKAAAKKQAKVDKTPELALRRDPSRVNEQSKALFLTHHLPEIAKLKALAKTAQGRLRAAYKTAKKDGFLQRDFDVAFQLKEQTGEKQLKAAIARDMTIAKWLGHALGKQLDMFVDAEEEDTEQRAYAAGEEASRRNKPAEPLYAPETVGYEAYMRGFHDHQEQLAKNITKIDQSSGTPMTRSQFKAQQMKKKADAAEERSLFNKRTAPTPDAAE